MRRQPTHQQLYNQFQILYTTNFKYYINTTGDLVQFPTTYTNKDSNYFIKWGSRALGCSENIIYGGILQAMQFSLKNKKVMVLGSRIEEYSNDVI